MSTPARQSEALGAKPALRIDWATDEAVAYACGHWHYSRSVPVSTNVKIGAWEDDRFIGIVLFSRGANRHIGNPYGLTQTECCELSRVALRDHCAPVSRIVMLAVKFLRRASPGLRLIVSYADTVRGHVGGIYQAMGWIYTGVGKTSRVVVHGEVLHGKTASSRYGKQGFNLKWLVANVDPKATRIDGGDKHRYLLPLDNAMRAQVAPLAKPYPKLTTPREKQAMTGPTGTAAAQHRPSRSILQTVTHARHAKRSRNRT